MTRMLRRLAAGHKSRLSECLRDASRRDMWSVPVHPRWWMKLDVCLPRSPMSGQPQGDMYTLTFMIAAEPPGKGYRKSKANAQGEAESLTR